VRRPSRTGASDNVSYTPVMANASPIAVEVAQEVYIETELEEQNEGESLNQG